MIHNVKAFCRETGYPLSMIRRMCRTGELPYLRNGRVMLVDTDVCKRILTQRASEHHKLDAGNGGKSSWKAELATLK